MFDPSYIATKF